MEKEKLEFYRTIYYDEPRWELIYNYVVEGKTAREMSKLEDSLCNNAEEKKSAKNWEEKEREILNRRKKHQRWTKAFQEEGNKLFVDNENVDRIEVIMKILDCYPDRNLFFKKDEPEKEWNGIDMMKIFNRKKRIRLTNHLYILQKFEYNEFDYEDGIAEYIEQSKRSLPEKVSNVYVYNAKIDNPFIYETGEGFDDREKCLGKYTISINNRKGRDLKYAYVIDCSMYRGKFSDYKSFVKIKDKSEESSLFDCTIYPLTYHLENYKEEWSKIYKWLEQLARRNVRKYETELFEKKDKLLYIRLGEKLFLIFDDSVRNAKFVREWAKVEKQIIGDF